MRTLTKTLFLIAFLPTIPGTGCQSPRIQERALRSQPILRAGSRALLPASRASIVSEEAAFARLRGEVEGPGGSTPDRLLELAELADGIGRREGLRDPASAMPWFRDAAVYATFSVISGGAADAASPSLLRAELIHNNAVEELLHAVGSGPRLANPVWREQLAALGVELAPMTRDRAGIPCNELWVARDFRVRNLDRVARDGMGVPLVVLSEFPDREAVPDRFYPPRLRLPATAVLLPAGPLRDGAWRSRPVSLALHDSAHESAVVLGDGVQGVPLAADLTTPLAHQFIQSRLIELAFGGLLRPDEYGSTLGIFIREPYQPGKIPVLFVHGLSSSPDAWMRMANDLQADPLIRSRYQFWFAYYPSGAPMMVSAGRLRQSLHDLRDAIDPRHGDRALDQMVVVGHSLGGLLSKQMLQTSGRSLERVLLTRPLEEVAMSPETRRLLSSYLFFTPEPSIRRAIFISAPHRGSNTANQLIGRLTSALVRRPADVLALHAEIVAMNGRDVFQPSYRRQLPTSVDNLAWESPILKALYELPIAPGVPYHSIVGNLFPDAPPGLWTDGVVSYESAHLDGAESEIMVRHDHTVNDTPEASAEVHRILRLHLAAAMESTPIATPVPGDQGRSPTASATSGLPWSLNAETIR